MDWIKKNYRTMLLVLFEVIALIWTAALLGSDLIGLDIVDVIPNKASLETNAFIGFIVFVIIVYVHIFSLHIQVMPRLDLVFGEGYPACVHKYKVGEKTYTLFRVGLINSGGKTIENVRVSLEQLEPQNITFGPIRLVFMHQRGDKEFRLHPGKEPSLFVDVIRDGYSTTPPGTIPPLVANIGPPDVIIKGPPERVFTLRYAVGGVPNTVKPGNYRLTLLAEGEDVPPCRKMFLANWDGDELTFMEEKYHD